MSPCKLCTEKDLILSAKGRNVIAWAICPGWRLTLPGALKARTMWALKHLSNSESRTVLFRAFSARIVLSFPGPMAQAITFRAFGAESKSNSTEV